MLLLKSCFNFNVYWTVAVSPDFNWGIVHVIELFCLLISVEIVPIFALETYAKSKLSTISLGNESVILRDLND